MDKYIYLIMENLFLQDLSENEGFVHLRAQLIRSRYQSCTEASTDRWMKGPSLSCPAVVSVPVLRDSDEAYSSNRLSPS